MSKVNTMKTIIPSEYGYEFDKLCRIKYVDSTEKITSLDVVVKGSIQEDNTLYLVLANGILLDSSQIIEFSYLILPKSAKTAPVNTISLDEISKFQLSKLTSNERRTSMV